MSFTETFCIQEVLFTDFSREKECVYWDYLAPTNENNKIMPSNIIFSLFVVTESVPIYIQMKDSIVVLYAPGWNGAICCLFFSDLRR